jgi:receptor protein-tyrosine kinase
MVETGSMSDAEEINGHDLMTPVRADVAPDQIEQQLIRIGKLTDRQVARAREVQRRRGIGFLEAAIAIGAVRREDLMSALSKQYSYPIIYSDTESARFSRELVVGHEPFGPAAESLRSIRTALVSSAIAAGTRTFAVVGPRQGAGSTFLASNLALAFAQMSVATLLVDANLRDPRIATMFGFDSNTEGLSETLSRKTVDHAPIAYDAIPGLSVMTSGAVPPNPQELLCSEEFLTLTSNLSRDFGIVIYDTPSALDYADAHVVAARVGSAIIVARKHKTKFNDVSTVAHKLQAIQCNVVGSILNDF